MSIKLNKTGIVNTSTIDTPYGHDLLYEQLGKYTIDSPYVLSGTSNDIYKAICNKVVLPTDLGNTFYLMAECSPSWAPAHGYSTASAGKATILEYLSKSTTADAGSYDSAVCYHSNNWIKEGIWKTTIDVNTYKSVSIRVNTYADGTNSATCKFWNIRLIPAAYFTDASISGKSACDIKAKNIVSSSLTEY